MPSNERMSSPLRNFDRGYQKARRLLTSVAFASITGPRRRRASLTLADPRWRDRLREIARTQELLCDAAASSTEYETKLEDLGRYFLAVAVAARNNH